MQIAQELYEGVDLGAQGTQGLITYMRTDSTNVASSAQQAAREEIASRYGPEYVPEKPPVYSRKAKGAQEAHEAIRPTAPHRDPASVKPFLSAQQFRLYQLIWQRFIASQMRPAMLDQTGVDIAAGREEEISRPGDPPFLFRATGSVVRFPGYMAVYQAGRDEGDAADELEKGALPPLGTGEDLDLLQLLAGAALHPAAAALHRGDAGQGAGREGHRPTEHLRADDRDDSGPWLCATEEKKLVATELGLVVNDLLVEHFPRVFDVGFTSQMEEELDEIASGDRAWVPTLHEFYGPFVETLARAEQTMERVRLKDEPAGEDCEQCGRPMVIKLGKFGKFLACSGFPECRNARPLLTTDRRALPDLPRRGGRRAAVEEGAHLLRLRALPGLRLRLLEQAGRSRLPALRQRLHGGGRPAGAGQVPGVRNLRRAERGSRSSGVASRRELVPRID